MSNVIVTRDIHTDKGTIKEGTEARVIDSGCAYPYDTQILATLPDGTKTGKALHSGTRHNFIRFV